MFTLSKLNQPSVRHHKDESIRSESPRPEDAPKPQQRQQQQLERRSTKVATKTTRTRVKVSHPASKRNRLSIGKVSKLYFHHFTEKYFFIFSALTRQFYFPPLILSLLTFVYDSIILSEQISNDLLSLLIPFSFNFFSFYINPSSIWSF